MIHRYQFMFLEHFTHFSQQPCTCTQSLLLVPAPLASFWPPNCSAVGASSKPGMPWLSGLRTPRFQSLAAVYWGSRLTLTSSNSKRQMCSRGLRQTFRSLYRVRRSWTTGPVGASGLPGSGHLIRGIGPRIRHFCASSNRQNIEYCLLWCFHPASKYTWRWHTRPSLQVRRRLSFVRTRRPDTFGIQSLAT